MTAITATRHVRFCAGHRVANHESKCARLHGHDYRLELTAGAEDLDDIGRVIDFSVLKERIGTWVDDFWDHRFLMWEGDPYLPNMPIDHHDVAVVPFNPTAENIAAYIGEVLGPEVLADTGVRLIHVRCWETPNCHADWSAE